MAIEVNFIEKLIASFDSIGVEKTYSRGEIILREGEVEKNLYFVVKGAVRVFYLSEYDEQIIRFGYQGSIINSLSSFLKEAPSEFYMDAIRKTTVKVISKHDLMALVNESFDNLKQYNKLLEMAITQQIDREVDILITSPTERLERVLTRSPNLFQQIPLKYIASYLRMTPETLSRIRKS